MSGEDIVECLKIEAHNLENILNVFLHIVMHCCRVSYSLYLWVEIDFWLGPNAQFFANLSDMNRFYEIMPYIFLQ